MRARLDNLIGELADLAAVALEQCEGPAFPWFAAGVTAVVTFLACMGVR